MNLPGMENRIYIKGELGGRCGWEQKGSGGEGERKKVLQRHLEWGTISGARQKPIVMESSRNL